VRRSKLVELFVAAGLGCVLLGALGAFACVKSGLYNVAASKPHTTFNWWLTNATMIHSVRRHARSIAAPERASAAQVARGFCIYETHCVACHGAAGVAREAWAGGMEPQPPYLLDATQKFSPAELFWIAKNGIKMTGMPSWRERLSDAQLWEVVAWLEASRQLPPQTYRRWRARDICGASLPSLSREGQRGGLLASGLDAREEAPSAASSGFKIPHP